MSFIAMRAKDWRVLLEGAENPKELKTWWQNNSKVPFKFASEDWELDQKIMSFLIFSHRQWCSVDSEVRKHILPSQNKKFDEISMSSLSSGISLPVPLLTADSDKYKWNDHDRCFKGCGYSNCLTPVLAHRMIKRCTWYHFYPYQTLDDMQKKVDEIMEGLYVVG